MDINSVLKQRATLVDDALKKYIKPKNNAQSDIYAAMEYSLFAGGKRLRPILTLLTCELCGGEAKNALPFACALEMIHTYSLIHDDLPAMDNDDLRRGKPTNHKVFGEATAILAGDALLNTAMEVALTSALAPDAVQKMLRVLFAASGTEGMIGGQVIDIKNDKLTNDALFELHLLKTGALIRASGVLGAMAAGAADEEIATIDTFCKNLGIAFQIRDDILDVTGTEKNLGKPIGSDADNNKTTYVTLFGLSRAEELLAEYTKNAQSALTVCFGDDAQTLCALAERLVSRTV